MLRNLLSIVILVPLTFVLVALAVANRDDVAVSFDLFGLLGPARTLHGPLSGVVFVALLAGVIVGGGAAWLAQAKWRRAARRHDRELVAARAETDRLRGKLAATETAQPLSLRPPAA